MEIARNLLTHGWAEISDGAEIRVNIDMLRHGDGVRPAALVDGAVVCVRWNGVIGPTMSAADVAYLIGPFVAAVYADRHRGVRDGDVVASHPISRAKARLREYCLCDTCREARRL